MHRGRATGASASVIASARGRANINNYRATGPRCRRLFKHIYVHAHAFTCGSSSVYKCTCTQIDGEKKNRTLEKYKTAYNVVQLLRGGGGGGKIIIIITIILWWRRVRAERLKRSETPFFGASRTINGSR